MMLCSHIIVKPNKTNTLYNNSVKVLNMSKKICNKYTKN